MFDEKNVVASRNCKEIKGFSGLAGARNRDFSRDAAILASRNESVSEFGVIERTAGPHSTLALRCSASG